MLTRADVLAIIRRVRYRDWSFKLLELRQVTGGWLMHVVFPDDRGVRQHGRKWYVSQHFTTSEVVQTCLIAVLTAIEHEAREAFLFDGVATHCPHFDIEAMKLLPHDRRQPMPVAEEPVRTDY